MNWEILTALDMKKMHEDVLKIIEASGEGERSILIVDGFSIFAYEPIWRLCHLKYFLTLTKEQCWERRKLRTYEPPDVPGYFEKVVWPEYSKQLAQIMQREELKTAIVFLDGSDDPDDIYRRVEHEVAERLT